MAKGSSGTGSLILYGVAAYLAYSNWPAISAWFSSLSVAAPAPTTATGIPASAGTIVSTGPTPAPTATPIVQQISTPPPTHATVPQPPTAGPIVWGQLPSSGPPQVPQPPGTVVYSHPILLPPNIMRPTSPIIIRKGFIV